MLVIRNSPEETWSIKPSIHGIFPMRFIGRTGGTNVATKERGRGWKKKLKKEERLDVSRHRNPRDTQLSRIDVIT